ncbi:hypothetical protein [Spiroplasma endosymbiont of Phyllotreta cruciferae]|uniref:hypothetical protein n=1 Tax=Spiroplasma endosymbiont of Phyllotreta cruciferae TaxID=2886375 RepID=UPI0020A016DD|nr:hypothetical protein [Spiroplasma endosymbiont of Phyllotreta cruciferae]
MKEFNPKKASLSTIYKKIDEFWENKNQMNLYTLNDLFNKLNPSARWRHDSYKNEKIVPLIEKQVDKIESELIKAMVKTHDGVKTYWNKTFNVKYAKQEQEQNINNQTTNYY